MFTPRRKLSTTKSPNKTFERTMDHSRSNKHPIFSQRIKQSKIFNLGHAHFDDQRLSFCEIIRFDYCGCEDTVTPCKIIQQIFLKEVPLSSMKQSYMTESFKTKYSDLNNLQFDKKVLFRMIPNRYPQIYFTHLNNLVEAFGINTYQEAEFQCLLAVQYHCKVEYLTYYLYKELKEYYSSMQHFQKDLDYEIEKLLTNRNAIHFQYNGKFLSDILKSFIANYFKSVGANLIPMTCYSRFLGTIYKNGKNVMSRFLAQFIVKRSKNLQQGLIFLKKGQLEKYRSHMRQLNFQAFIEQSL